MENKREHASAEEPWPDWEDWRIGWEISAEGLSLEGRPVDRLPPHLPWPEGCAHLRFPFENGWEALVYAESWGPAVGAMGICGVNRRIQPRIWPLPADFADPGFCWQEDEMEALGGSTPYLDGPDHLRVCFDAISVLVSAPGERRGAYRLTEQGWWMPR